MGFLEGEEPLGVDQGGGEAELEQCFAHAAVASLADAVHLELGELALDERSSSEFPAGGRTGLFGAGGLEPGFVEVEGEAAAVDVDGAPGTEWAAPAELAELEDGHPAVLVVGAPAEVGGGVAGGAGGR